MHVAYNKLFATEIVKLNETTRHFTTVVMLKNKHRKSIKKRRLRHGDSR